MLPSQLPDIGNAPVAVDTETSGLHIDDGARVAVVSIAYEDDNGEIAAWAFPFDQGIRDKLPAQELDLFGDVNLPETEWEALFAWLQQRCIVMHNAKFDCHMARVGTRHWAGQDLMSQVIYDTSLGNKELWPIEPTALKPTAERLALQGGGERDDEQILKEALRQQGKKLGSAYSKRYDLLPWDVIEPYATKDAVLTLLLFWHQLDEIDLGFAQRHFIDRELEVCKTLYRLETRGIGYDSAASLSAAGRLRTEMVKIGNTFPFEASATGAKRYWFGRNRGGLGLEPYEITKNGQPAINDVVLKRMANDGVAWVKEYQTWNKLKNALSMWYEAYPSMVGDDGRLRTSYRQTKEEGASGGGVVSGRFSVERINLQAIPHKSRLELPIEVPTPRQFFRPREGYELWEADLSQAELRVGTVEAGCVRMRELIEAKADLHGVTCQDLFQIGSDSEEFFKYRQVAKRGNFSFIFGVGPDTFKATLFKETGILLTQNEAINIVEAWRRLYPEFGRAIWKWDRYAEYNRNVPLVNGRKRWFYPLEYTHKAFNQRVQGSLAEFAKEWAIETDRRFPGSLLLLIHDSQVMELPEGEGEAVMQEVQQLGRDLGTKWFKIPMDVDYGLWGEH